MAKLLPPLSRPQQQRKRRCGSCGKLYVGRPRRETVCLTCDIRGRAARGESRGAIAVRFGIPRFLVEAVLEPASRPTRKTLGGRRSAILGDPRARSFPETAPDRLFRTIRLGEMGEESGVIARTLPRHARGLGAGAAGGNAGYAPVATSRSRHPLTQRHIRMSTMGKPRHDDRPSASPRSTDARSREGVAAVLSRVHDRQARTIRPRSSSRLVGVNRDSKLSYSGFSRQAFGSGRCHAARQPPTIPPLKTPKSP